jgi:hypothetical protein
MWQFATMKKTHVQIPDELYRKVKQIAKEREWSLAEVMRRGLEYMTMACPPVLSPDASLPVLNANAFADGLDRLDLKSISAEDESMRSIE